MMLSINKDVSRSDSPNYLSRLIQTSDLSLSVDYEVIFVLINTETGCKICFKHPIQL